MSAEAELLITPDVSRQALQRSMSAMEGAMKKVAKQAERDLEDAIADGMKGGAKRGGRSIRQAMKQGVGNMGKAWDSTGGARSAVAGGLIGMALSGLFEAINRADQGTGLIGELMGGSTAADDLMAAKAVGLTDAQRAQFKLNMGAAGQRDQGSINEMLISLNERAMEQAMTGEGELSKFGKLSASERLPAILASIGNLDPQTQAMWLNMLEVGDENVLPMMRMMEQAKARAGGHKLTAADIFGAAGGVNVGMTDKFGNPIGGTHVGAQASAEATAAAELTRKEASMAADFQAREAKADEAERSRLIGALNPGTMDAYFSERRRVATEQLKILNTYGENIQTANLARAGISKAMDLMVANSGEALKKLDKLIEAVRNDEGVAMAMTNAATGHNQPVKATSRDKEMAAAMGF